MPNPFEALRALPKTHGEDLETALATLQVNNKGDKKAERDAKATKNLCDRIMKAADRFYIDGRCMDALYLPKGSVEWGEAEDRLAKIVTRINNVCVPFETSAKSTHIGCPATGIYDGLADEERKRKVRAAMDEYNVLAATLDPKTHYKMYKITFRSVSPRASAMLTDELLRWRAEVPTPIKSYHAMVDVPTMPAEAAARFLFNIKPVLVKFGVGVYVLDAVGVLTNDKFVAIANEVHKDLVADDRYVAFAAALAAQVKVATQPRAAIKAMQARRRKKQHHS